MAALAAVIVIDANVFGGGGQEILAPTPVERNDIGAEVSIAVSPELPVAAAAPDRAEASSRPAPTGPDTDPETFFVSPQIGDDNSDGQTLEAPWRSLQTSLDRLQPGQTLFLMDGEYSESTEPTVAHYVVRVDGLPEAWINITAAPGHEPTLRPNNGEGMSIRGDYVEVSGLTIRGDGYGAENPYGYGLLVLDAHHVRVIGNKVSDMPVSGISAIESSNLEIYNNEVFDNSFWGTEQGSGISIWHAKDHGHAPSVDGYHDKIIGNLTYRNENKVFSRWAPGQNVISDGNGIIIDESRDLNYTGRTLVANNIAFDNGGRGIHVFRSSRVDVVHNTTFQNGRTDILQAGPVELSANESSDVRIFNNLAWSRPGAPGVQVNQSNEVTMGGNVFVTDNPSGLATAFDLVTSEDPGLAASTVDPAAADFRPIPGSVLINRALLFDPMVGVDAAGLSRPASAAAVGAYESAQLTSSGLSD